MQIALVWIYIINSVLLINHELDSAYWREWNLFKNLSQKLFGYKDDITGIKIFLIIHFPFWIILLYGLLALSEITLTGYIISLVVSIMGIVGFCIHTYFLKKDIRSLILKY